MNIELNDVRYSYPVWKGTAKPALQGVTLRIPAGECFGIVGPEGAGKSTLLLLLKGLAQADSGSILVGGNDILSGGLRGKALRRKIGLAFQFPGDQFLDQTVREEILNGVADKSGVRLHESLKEQGLDPERYLNRSPFQLSMGEARRVVLSTLLMRRPEVLLMDEPTVGLDGHGLSILSETLHQQTRWGVTIVLVSHDLGFLGEHAKKIYGFVDGTVVIEGPVSRVLSNQAELKKIGYDLPEVSRIHERFWDSGEVPRGEFLKNEDLRELLRRGGGLGRVAQ